DLVLNNVNAPAAIYRNRAREVTGNAYLTVLLRGVGANTAGIGAKVLIKEGGDRTQLLEQLPTRGFLSSVDPRLHFGLGPGPALAVGDVNGDGLDDIYVGGAKWQVGQLFVQQHDGTFRVSAQPAFAADSLSEDVDAVFFDADGDGHSDLYVVSGGNEFWGDHDALQDRLYMNDGKGHFHRAPDALLRFAESGSCVVAGDVNGDGREDLVLGNLGLNSYLRASPAEPARLYVGDFGHNGTREQILTFYKHGVSYPLAGRDELVRLLPQLRSRYPSYAAF